MMTKWSVNWPQAIGALVKLGLLIVPFLVLLCLGSLQSLAAESCSGREVLTAPSGLITDGQGDYPPSAHCEWLIQGEHCHQISIVRPAALCNRVRHLAIVLKCDT